MDAVPPRPRPDGPNGGTQNWRELLFLHWRYPIDVMQSVLPEGMEVDAWEGDAWLGAVPFLMRDVAPSWWPGVFAFDFLECNLRTYVRVNGEQGVYFFSLEADSWLAVQAARTGWGLPYHHASMQHAREGDTATFETTRKSDGSELRVRYRVGEALPPSTVGSPEAFFLERYLLFSDRRGVRLRGEVHHVPYPARRVELDGCAMSLERAAGLPALDRPPELVHFSDGVDVEVFNPAPVR